MAQRPAMRPPRSLHEPMSTGVILLAAGSGRRFGGRRPKQFLPLNGRPLFLRPLLVFSSIRSVTDIVVVASPSEVEQVKKMVAKVRLRKPVAVVAGGKFRGASVRNGLRSFNKIPDVVLVHDSARPLIDADVIRRVEQAVKRTGVALAAWPLPDTLKKSNGSGRVKKTIRRKDLWLAQTPQGFRKDRAEECLLHPSISATDDVELAERKGYPVEIVLGASHNFKVTYPFDYELAKKLA